MSTQTATTYEPDYLTWLKLGFRRTTARVTKRQRPDGLLDVVFREANGCYSAWVSEASSIWMVVLELITFDGLQDLDDLHQLVRHFPAEPIALAQQPAFQASLPPLSATDSY
ncbi:hypothetical protein [Hymenobacter sp. BT491]|uniref:hypothetical protein n=1 Tax=Hymenobacter sp. BT491 TaxID=2766779 RepID=UPI0016538BCE|nr:hypothetical protein [Hymenobacter sp. BT491]MBC6988543.1 hypothetical protein [Hymenobacter sp. BT491]